MPESAQSTVRGSLHDLTSEAHWNTQLERRRAQHHVYPILVNRTPLFGNAEGGSCCFTCIQAALHMQSRLIFLPQVNVLAVRLRGVAMY